jgi:hypothetical protein
MILRVAPDLPPHATCDTFKTGNPAAEVRGVVVTWMATRTVLERADPFRAGGGSVFLCLIHSRLMRFAREKREIVLTFSRDPKGSAFVRRPARKSDPPRVAAKCQIEHARFMGALENLQDTLPAKIAYAAMLFRRTFSASAAASGRLK